MLPQCCDRGAGRINLRIRDRLSRIRSLGFVQACGEVDWLEDSDMLRGGLGVNLDDELPLIDQDLTLKALAAGRLRRRINEGWPT